MARLLPFIADTDNNDILQYTVVAGVALIAGLRFLIQPLLPHFCMDDIEHVIRETKDIFDKAQEEHLFRDRVPRLDIQLRLSRAQEEQSYLRSRVLDEHGLSCSAREYLFILSDLARQLRRCRRQAKAIQLCLLRSIEDERRGRHCERVEEIAAVLSSARFRSSD
ncbi:hypothetical protein MIND_00531900 [Mycena indigotica]|uniref:Uncharacterized protein n=1 Tax=Mycena indigotica TaxID=2126181 RepID=A0A8H6SWR8_9AGAR|nr:uncharacterized protein MIND_00531900 [Mycena indigotica]KAF7307378.1 hypothetical protein MIND_00531900 [Mycena indigotica]